VTIGSGAVIGCNSVVSRNVAEYAIVVGNPAREVKKRFTDLQIKRLLELAWWELERDQIVQVLPLLCSNDIDHFCDVLEKLKR
jgi:chloramphenicol O-acetyltransferase type B